MKIKQLLTVLLVLAFNRSMAQADGLHRASEDSKIFQKSKLDVIRNQYLNENGNPSHAVFLSENGLKPYDKNTESSPYFTVTISKDDLIIKNGKIRIKKSAEYFNLDFYVKSKTVFKSNNQAIPVWDGRVYSENNNLIVGGYSEKYNERPVGFIDEKGNFVKNNRIDSGQFPLLKIPSGNLKFDPFNNLLLKIEPSNDEEQTKQLNRYLPIDLYGKNGELLNSMQFEIIHQKSNSKLILVGIVNGEKVEIASCNTLNSKLTNRKEAFRPELIEGASQLGNGDMISLTFEGGYSQKINIVESDLYLSINKSVDTSKRNPDSIKIDGDFRDWRNISGISDIKGDFVSYLFENPDTDLLEFKVTNDSKYIYFYSRVAGAHGRTGEKGRYYWYTYIDVDRNSKTGYPPTRDDNCYFGIPIGDDSEAQFEFIGNKFVKTFFGFTGIGAEKEVLSGELKLGPSYYSRTDKNGNQRDRYKMEYVHRENSRFITEDYTEGTSEDIVISLSPDGSEVEVKVEMAGFLKDINGKALIEKGLKIDIAVGVEGSSDHYNSNSWGADSSQIIYGYEIK